ncbi:uncharacterized protein [Littorina saxatilis]
MLGMKRATCLTEFRKTKTWLENEGNADYFKRTKEEFSKLSPEDKELFRKKATERGIPSTMKDRQSYANLLTDQMTNVRKVVEQMGGFVSFHLILDGEHRRAASTQMCLIEDRLQYPRDLTSLVAQSERKQKNLSEATAADGDRGAKKDEKQELRRQVQAVLNKAYQTRRRKQARTPLLSPDEPSIAEPGVAESGVAEPSIAQPGVAQPGVAQPGVAQPGVAQPGVAQPGVAQPGVAQPGVAQPGVAQPGVAQPGVTKPSQNEPSDSVIDLREMAKVEEDTVIGILNLLSEGGAGDKTLSDAQNPHLAKRSRKVDLPVEKESEGEEQPLIKKPRVWTREEDAIILEAVGNRSNIRQHELKELIDKFPEFKGRTRSSVNSRLRLIALKKRS